VKAFATAIYYQFSFNESVQLNFPPAKDAGNLYFIVKMILSVKYYIIIFCFELH